MVPRGRGTDANINKRKGVISGILDVKVYAIDFFKLSKINLPKERRYSKDINSNAEGHIPGLQFDPGKLSVFMHMSQDVLHKRHD